MPKYRTFYVFSFALLSYSPFVCYGSALALEIDQGISVKKTDTSTKIVISHQQIVASGAQNLTEVLRQFAGIQLQDLVGDGSQLVISMRGFGDNAAANSLVLIDGVPLANSDLGSPELNLVSVQDIDHLEIFYGSQGVRYGNQAVGGVVNIITRKGEAHHFNIETTLASFAGHSIYTAISKQQGHWQVYQSGQLYGSDNQRDHNRTSQGHLFGHVNYVYDSGNLALSYVFFKRYQLFAGSLSQQQVDFNPYQSQNQDDFGRVATAFFHLQHQQLLSSHWHTLSDISFRNDQGDFVISQTPFNQSRLNFFIEPKIEGEYPYNDWLLGLSENYNQYHLYTNAFEPTHAVSNQYDLFEQITLKLLPRWRFILGTRLAEQESDIEQKQYLNTVNSVFVTTEGIEYDLTSHLNWFIRRDGNFRFPKIDEQTFVPSNISQLQTQTGISYETGLNYQKLNNRAQITLFQLDLNHEIAFDPTQNSFQPFGANCNLDPTRRIGVLVAASQALNSKVSLTENIVWLDARFRSGEFIGNQIPFVSKWSSEMSVTYHLIPHDSIFTEINYIGKRYPLSDLQNQGEEVPRSVILNLANRYEQGHFYIEGRINNLNNHYYNAVVTLQPLTNQSFFYPAMGRSYWLTLGYKN